MPSNLICIDVVFAPSWNVRKSDSLFGWIAPQRVGASTLALSGLSFGSTSGGQDAAASTEASKPPLVVPLVPPLVAPLVPPLVAPLVLPTSGCESSAS